MNIHTLFVKALDVDYKCIETHIPWIICIVRPYYHPACQYLLITPSYTPPHYLPNFLPTNLFRIFLPISFFSIVLLPFYIILPSNSFLPFSLETIHPSLQSSFAVYQMLNIRNIFSLNSHLCMLSRIMKSEGTSTDDFVF